MSDFSETWKAMSVEQRAKHIVRDWQDSRESNDPMVLRVAAVVAHAVLQELVSKTDELRAERDEARRSCCEFAAMVDSADTVVMYVDSNRFHEIAMRYMKSRGWDCFKENTND